ncbi:MAG: CRISPR-associated endonuclease Cas1 [Cellulomonadaceae bacterium]|jgi:CRISPR-associated protein Cas1|nr:CRISPR-associated endonuclease Cas1 [Cellulomonadaceae bacterium]
MSTHTGGDRINAMLNYGYGILRAHGVRATLAAGLDPALGMWHSHRSNAFNLVADLMEPFRPAIDYAIINAPRYSALSKPETKKYLAATCAAPFGQSRTHLPASIAALASRYALYIEGRANSFDAESWQPPSSPPTTTTAAPATLTPTEPATADDHA